MCSEALSKPKWRRALIEWRGCHVSVFSFHKLIPMWEMAWWKDLLWEWAYGQTCHFHFFFAEPWQQTGWMESTDLSSTLIDQTAFRSVRIADSGVVIIFSFSWRAPYKPSQTPLLVGRGYPQRIYLYNIFFERMEMVKQLFFSTN